MSSYIKLTLQYLFLILTLLASTYSAQGCDIRCKCGKNKMRCDKYMPLKLPDGIKMLTVEGKADETGVDKFWTDNSWNKLESMTLQNYSGYSFGEIYRFSNLINLSYFGPHSTDFDQLKNSNLKAMPYLKVLDLSGTTRLRFPVVLSALKGGNLPNLEVLNLDSVATDGAYTSMNRFGNSFIKVLLGKPLKKLIITNTMLEIDTALLFQIHTLEFLNISGPWIPSNNVPIPQEFRETNNVTLDLSVSMIEVFKTKTDFVIRDFYAKSCLLNAFLKMMTSVTNLYLNNILDMRVSLINVTYNMSHCLEGSDVKVNTKTLFLRKNGLKQIDVKFIDNTDIGLTFLDLSGNILEYVSPDFFKILGSLSTLDLSSNYLYKMEQNPHFELLFKHVAKLNFINLSANQISVIPSKIFTHNKNLAKIDLSLNKISKVDFNIQQLHDLKILNLAGNRIQFIEMDFLQKLDKLSIFPSLKVHNGNDVTTKVIILNDNQFHCSCNSVTFLKWLMSQYNQTETKRAPTCLLDGTSTALDVGVIGKSKFLCIKETVTIATYISSVLFVVAIISILFVCYVRRRRRIKGDRVKRLKQTLCEQTAARYLIFFSYCGEDENIAMEHIYPKLSQALRTCVDCNQELICVGNLKFRPGFSIHEEMVKCISESYVVALLVSNAFCESRWCETEIKEAATQNKPVVLFLLDHVDEDMMSPYLRTLFRRYTRVIITIKNNEVELSPDMSIICQSLIELAADSQKQGGFYELFDRSVHYACCKI
ncbi:toll-like receptor 6 [Mercenaria mercenaria]|uniref:toll-like receptor 6 n=1 Tax=Mercenaria mercenaria TaxID=6596 RepID=UPI00234E8ED2|nr:toll-like receptor 6 [Mercenaria mercenaria]